MKRRVISFVGGVLLFGALIYFALAGLLYVSQAQLLFFPTRSLAETPADAGWAFEEVELAVGDETTHGWFVEAPGEPRGVVLFSHGNAGNIGDRVLSISTFRDLGFQVLAYDYGGYGKSTGKPSEARCYSDIRAMWAYLTETRGIAPDRIVLFGRSMGAGATCELATDVKPGAIVLESPFRSVAAMAKELYPIFPFGTLVKHRFDNEAKVGALRAPVLFVHSPDDEIIPYSHGRRLYELASEPKEFLEIRGGHNDGFWVTGEAYVEGLDAFLRQSMEQK